MCAVPLPTRRHAGDRRVALLDLSAPHPIRATRRDALGRHLRTLVDAKQPAGIYSVLLDAGGLYEGTYAHRVEAGAKAVTRTLALSR